MKKFNRGLLGFCFTAFGVSMMVHVHDVGLEPWSAAIVGLVD